jgi:hypothetical protein
MLTRLKVKVAIDDALPCNLDVSLYYTSLGEDGSNRFCSRAKGLSCGFAKPRLAPVREQRDAGIARNKICGEGDEEEYPLFVRLYRRSPARDRRGRFLLGFQFSHSHRVVDPP